VAEVTAGDLSGEADWLSMLRMSPQVESGYKRSGLRWCSDLPPSMADAVVLRRCAGHGEAVEVELRGR
jgi:hypothetical protein